MRHGCATTAKTIQILDELVSTTDTGNAALYATGKIKHETATATTPIDQSAAFDAEGGQPLLKT